MVERILETAGGASQRSPQKVLQYYDYKGNRLLELGEWYWHKGLHDWKKKKGVTLNKTTYRVIRDAIIENDEEILDFLAIDYVPEHVRRYEEVTEMAAEEARYKIGDVTVSSHNEPRDPIFFRIEHLGGIDEGSFNTSHPFWAAFQQMTEAEKGSMLKVIQGFNHAKEMLQDTPAFDPKTLFRQMEIDWSKYLRDTLDGSR